MELYYGDGVISFQKELNSLDRFVIDFTKVLDKLNIKYVLISGYVAILFGRNRSSEDVDIFMEKISISKYKKLWNILESDFECINTKSYIEAYNDYLSHNIAVRFSYCGEFIPNMEVKFPKNTLDQWLMKNKILVNLNKNKIYISPIELQITYKLILGSEKDIEDSRYLYGIFKDHLDKSLLNEFKQKFNIINEFNRYLK